MKLIIVSCLLFVCVYSAPSFNTLMDTPWLLFKASHEKQYATNEEENLRRSIWESNLAKINKHNTEADTGIHSYRLKINRFGDLTNDEFNMKMKGFNMNLKEQLTDLDHHLFRAPANVKLPDAIDWRTKGHVTPVKDQKQCGSCWAFSATGSLEGQHFTKTGQLISLSEQNLVDCSTKYGNNGCDGGLMDYAFQYIKENNGIDTESSYPYEARDGKCRFDPKNIGATVTGFVDIKSKNETDLQYAIATVGPVSVAIDASHASFQFYHSGVYNEASCSPTRLDHGVLAVGYDSQDGKDYYIVKNSWGTSWGNKGYIWMTRNKSNQCGIATMASYPLV